jgi:hypothetical protein
LSPTPSKKKNAYGVENQLWSSVHAWPSQWRMSPLTAPPTAQTSVGAEPHRSFHSIPAMCTGAPATNAQLAPRHHRGIGRERSRIFFERYGDTRIFILAAAS